MKLEFDKEIDSLLREGARRGRAAPVRRGASEREEDGGLLRATSSGAHLDADEQNAYAENSLPPSARTHYAAHLADCDDCRLSVTQLALAAGVPAQLEQQAATATGQSVSPDVTWRERLGALLAPRAWRYAVPALALLLVGAVALMVLMRGQRNGDVSVARNNKSEAERVKPAQSESHHASQNSNNAAVSGEGSAQPAPNSNAPLTKEEIAAGVRQDQGQPPAGVIVTDATAPPPPPLSTSTATTSAPVAAAAAPPMEMPMPAPTPASVAEPPVVAQEAEAKVKVTERADESAKDVQKLGNYENNQQRERISGPRRNEQSRNIQRGINAGAARGGADKNDAVLAATPTPAPPAATAERRAPQREADGERNARPSDDAKKSESMPSPKPVTETRTVAGRKFRRAGSAWIDTAYNSSQAVTVVKRNSEQYRALVADEPELRRIRDALGGEVIVLWKGRAYRIK